MANKSRQRVLRASYGLSNSMFIAVHTSALAGVHLRKIALTPSFKACTKTLTRRTFLQRQGINKSHGS